MMHLYDELYLPCCQRVMGDMYDYAVNTLSYDISAYHSMFLVSGMAVQFESGNPTYIAGKNGCEIAREVITHCTDRVIDKEDIMYTDKSREYWTGWSLSYYQWESCRTYREINRAVPIADICDMYTPLHEADISLFVRIMEEKMNSSDEESMLKRLRTYCGLSQSMLSKKSGVALRQIQLFEQGQRDITKTGGTTLFRLARALNCRMEDLVG